MDLDHLDDAPGPSPAGPSPAGHPGGPGSPGPRGRGARRRRSAAVALAVAALVAGALAHRLAGEPAAPASPTASLAVAALQDRAADAARAAAPSVSVDWGGSRLVISPGGVVLDAQREGVVESPAGNGRSARSGPGSAHVAYRTVLQLPAGSAERPCLLPTVEISAWQYAQGGDASLPCHRTSGPTGGRSAAATSGSSGGAWALREGTAQDVAVREVVVARGTRVDAVAAWAVGPGARPPLSAAQLRRVVAAVAAGG